MLKKVPIKNILPNPYRGINKYPIDREKVNELIESYKKTGMWIGIVGRPHNNNGKVEISFGHHRLEAAKKLGYKEINVDIHKIDNSDMIRMMADENMDRKINTKIINQTVLCAKEFLQKEINKHKTFNDYQRSSSRPLDISNEQVFSHIKTSGIGNRSLMQFLGKSWQTNIEFALKTIKDNDVDMKAVEIFERPTHADTIREKLKEHKVPKAKQKEVAKKVKQKIETEIPKQDKKENKKGEVSSQRIKDVMDDEFFGKTYKEKKEKKRPDINAMLNEYTEKLKQINLSLDEVIKNIEYANDMCKSKFAYQAKELFKKITKGGKKCKQLKQIK